MKKEVKTFYPDLSKNHDFIDRIQKILARANSSIAMCFMTQSITDRYVIFFESYKKNSDQLTFSFHTSDDIFSEKSHARYIEEGFNKEDLELLTDLFSDFALSNNYESAFFGSLFFIERFRDFTPRYILKYIESEENNRFLIDGIKLSRHYAVETSKAIKYALTTEANRSNNKKTTLQPCNSYLLQDHVTLENAIKKLNSLPIRQDLLIAEYYQDYETNRGFLKNVFKVENDILKEIDIIV